VELLSSVSIGYGLIIAGTMLLAIAVIGRAFSRSSQPSDDRDSKPTPRPKMPPLPTFLDSSRGKDDK
jgi:hypothetical protein